MKLIGVLWAMSNCGTDAKSTMQPGDRKQTDLAEDVANASPCLNLKRHRITCERTK